MSLTTLKSVSSGAIFGAALTVAGVYSPSVIIAQMHLTDFHMLKSFLSASAASAIAILLAQNLHLTACKPRLPSPLGLLGPYDGNLIGGTILGVGMALTGACPGTVLPQVSTSIPSAPYVLFGCAIGGILFSKLKKYIPFSSPSAKPKTENGFQKEKEKENQAFTKPALYQRLNISKYSAIMIYESLCLSAVAAASYYSPEKYEVIVPPAVGGLIIGGAQAASLALTGFTLGVSNAYEQIGDLFWWLVSLPFNTKAARPNIKGTAFALGGLLGSWGLSQVIRIPEQPGNIVVVGKGNAVIGGVLLVLGARIAGGCTSGHGISGMSQLSIASLVTVMGMFGAGVGVSLVLG